MEDVTNLVALATESDVGELGPERVGQYPMGEDPLLGVSHLPRTRHDTTAVHDRS